MRTFLSITLFLWIPVVVSVLDKALNQQCTSDEDCSIAYSVCDKSTRTCQCTKGFTSDGTGCKWPGLACPSWEGSPNSKPGKACVYKYDSYTGVEKHSCESNTEICYTYPKTQTPTGEFEFVGHCCPKPPANARELKMNCPLMVQELNGTCPDLTGQPVDMPMTGDKLRTCPWTTHDCLMRSGV